MDKAEKGLGLLEKLIGLLGIGIVLPIVEAVVIFLLIKYIYERLKVLSDQATKAATLAETRTNNDLKLLDKIEEIRRDGNDRYNRIVVALVKLASKKKLEDDDLAPKRSNRDDG